MGPLAHRPRSAVDRRILVAIVLCAGLACAGAPAGSRASDGSRLRPIAGGIDAFASDGERFVAWQRPGAAAVVLDTRGHRRSAIPMSCALQDRARAASGRFLVSCGSQTDVFDAVTTTLTPLPSRLYGPLWEGVGTRYAFGQAGYGTSCPYGGRAVGCTALFDLATGTERLIANHYVPEVDHRGAPPVCRALRRTVYDLESGSLPAEGSYAEGLLARWLNHGEAPVTEVQLDRCDGRRTIVPSPATPQDIEVGGDLVSWDTGHGTSDIHARGGFGSAEEEALLYGGETELITYSPATRRRKTWRLPQRPIRIPLEPTLVGVWGYSAHTDSDVFWAGAETGTCDRGCEVSSYVLYAAPR
jgi:hypothetical protein